MKMNAQVLGAVAGMLVAVVVRAEDPIAQLRAAYPEVRVCEAGRFFKYFTGTAMTSGNTEAEAATSFLSQHGAAFGGPEGGSEFVEQWAHASPDGRFIVYAYRQKIGGKDVDGSMVRVRVKRGATARVDYAAARLAGEPSGGATPLVPAGSAGLIVQALSGIQGLIVEETPEQVILRGNAHRADTWCWRVRTVSSEGSTERRRTYYLDTGAPRILHVRNHFWTLMDPPTTGNVQGEGTTTVPPVLPYKGSVTATHQIPRIRVNGSPAGGTPVFSYANGGGVFSITTSSGGPGITLDTSFYQQAQWYRVDLGTAPQSQYLFATSNSTVGSDLTLALGGSGITEEHGVAQVDAVVTANRCRDFLHTYISSSVNFSLTIRPNKSGPCASAGGSGSSFAIEFAPQVTGRWNCASHSNVSHEFGHCVASVLGVDGHSGFNEGFSDAISHMVNDDSVLGREQNMSGSHIRDDPTVSGINCQYPIPDHETSECFCSDGHNGGQLLSGPWVRIRNTFKTQMGAGTGLSLARTVFGEWALITLGGDDDCGSAHPGTLAEALGAASVEEESVQAAWVEAAFAAHNICFNGACN